MASDTQTGYTELDDVIARKSFWRNTYLMRMTLSHLQVKEKKIYRQRLFNTALTSKDFLDVALDALWKELDSLVPLLKLLPALQVEDNAYVLSGNVSQADWDRLQYYSRRVKFFKAMLPDTDDPQVHPSTYFRIAQLQSSALFPSLRRLHYDLGNTSISHLFFFLSPLLDSLELFNISGFENTIVGPFLATLPSQMLSLIVLRTGRMSADIFKKSIVHFKQLRSLELSDAVFMSDFVLLEVLGTLPSLVNLTLKATDPASHPTHAPENSNSQSGGPRYFDALERLCVTGSFFFIQHLLGFIDSPCLNSITMYPIVNNRHEDRFTPSMTIITSRWSQSLTNLVIDSALNRFKFGYAISKFLTVLHEMQTFHLTGWMDNIDDEVRRLAMSWPKLRTLKLSHSQLSLSTLRIIAEKCPELRCLHTGIRLDPLSIPPVDTSSKCLHHNLEVLIVGAVHPSDSTQTTLECQIQVTRHLDLIFPYLKSIGIHPSNVFWLGIRGLVRLCQNARQITNHK